MTSSPTPAVLPDARAQKLLNWQPAYDDRVRPLLLAEASRRDAADWNESDAENVIAFLLATPPASDAAVPAGEVYRHLKRGTTYEVLGTAELQASQLQAEHAELVIYRGADGKLWARNSGEFHDGRFVPLKPAGDGGEA